MPIAQRMLGLTSIALAVATQAQCGSNQAPTPSTAKTVIGPEGGQVVGADGSKLTIPPGALATPTEVSMTSLASFSDPNQVAGVHLAPDGLTLNAPATLEIPLHAMRPPGADPKRFHFLADPSEAYDTGEFPTLSADRSTAIIQVTHFSGDICADNCHAGTREYLTARFKERGCSADAVADEVHKSFKDANLSPKCTWLDGNTVQAMLDTFFDDKLAGGYDEGADVPPNVIKQLADYASQGRNVVIAFKRGTFGARGASGFYDDVSHTAALEFRNGEWQIRNTVVVSKTVLTKLGGTNLVWWPLSDLNGFRKTHAMEGVEIAACGSPGCLGSDRGGPYPPLGDRPVPWSAVRIYVEKSPTFTCADAGAPPPDAAPPPAEAAPPPPTEDAGLPPTLPPPPTPPTTPPSTTEDAGVPPPPPPFDAGPPPAPEDAGAPEDAWAQEAAPPDAAPREAAPAEAAPREAAAVDAAPREAAACPTYTKSIGFCAGQSGCPADGGACACAPGSEFCCVAGFCYTRDIAGCQQEHCPPGLGRHDDDTCACGTPKKAAYDPCRPGFMLTCQ